MWSLQPSTRCNWFNLKTYLTDARWCAACAGQKKDKKEKRAARKERKQGGADARSGSAASVRQPTADELAAAGARLGPRAQAEHEEAARKAAAEAEAAAAQEEAHVSVSEESGSGSDEDENALVQVRAHPPFPSPLGITEGLAHPADAACNDDACWIPLSALNQLACGWAHHVWTHR